MDVAKSSNHTLTKQERKLTMDTVLSKALREFLSGPLNQLIVNLGGKNGAKVEEELKKFNRGEPCWIKEEVEQVETQPAEKVIYTRLISGDEEIIIDATDGSVTISSSANVFKGGIYNHSGVTLGVQGQARGPIRVSVHEQIVDGSHAQIFGVHVYQLFTEHQVVEFVEKNQKWLRKGGYATFLPFIVGNEQLVAHFHFCFDDGGPLYVSVYRFSDSCVWDAEYRHRIVFLRWNLIPSVS